MERACFLVEETGERISFLLNPESVVLRRSAGVHRLSAAGGKLAGSRLRDDPVIHTGGGRTEIDLALLFDVDLAGSSVATEDVRNLTRPLWDWSEIRRLPDRPQRSPRLLLIWGKTWNVPVLISALSERLESFTAAGIPRRSWVRIRLVRVQGSDRWVESERADRLQATEFGGAPKSESAQARMAEARLGQLEGLELDAFERARSAAVASGSPEDWRNYLG